jgi:hypothetical protein
MSFMPFQGPGPSGPPFGPPGQQGGPPGPPFGPPGQQGGPPGPPFGPPGQQGGGAQAPTAPPPQFTPAKPSATAFAVDPGAISRCIFRNTYVWLNNGQNFWFFPVFVGRTSVAGFRWTGRFWIYFGIDLRNIDSFTCF